MNDYEPVRRKKRSRKRRRQRFKWLRIICGDILLTCLFINCFALFHHVIPKMGAITKKYIHVIEEVTPSPELTPAPAISSPEPEISAEPADTSASDEIAEEAEIEDSMPEEIAVDPNDWTLKFQDKFTDEIVQTDTTYSSPNVSITVTKHSGVYDDYPVEYYLADIYISSLDCFRTGSAEDIVIGNQGESPIQMDKRTGALLQINGDYTTARQGFLVRNGELYIDEQTSDDICVMYKDGSIKTYASDGYKVADILSEDPYQVWRFGPQLLEEDGSPCENFNTTYTILGFNPRTAIGYFEPGHYVFMVAEGRTNTSRGFKLNSMAQVFSELGCTAAYNLDGGASTVMTFNDKKVNFQTEDRWLSDTLYITEPDSIA